MLRGGGGGRGIGAAGTAGPGRGRTVAPSAGEAAAGGRPSFRAELTCEAYEGWGILERMRAHAAVFALLLSLSAGSARAQTSADAELTAIRQSMQQAGFRSAASAVESYLARTDLNASQRNSGLEIDAIVSLARRDEARATASLRELYSRDPGHRLSDPDASPVVQGAFARARDAASPLPVTLESDSPAQLERRAPIIRVRVADGADRVHELRLNFRAAGAGRFTAVVITPEADGAGEATLPVGTDPEAQRVEYYIEALAPSGTALGTLGTEAEPRRVVIAAAPVVTPTVVTVTEERPVEGGGGDVTGEWWFWTLIGVAVVGAGVGVGVGVVSSQPRSPDGSLGNVSLPLVSF